MHWAAVETNAAETNAVSVVAPDSVLPAFLIEVPSILDEVSARVHSTVFELPHTKGELDVRLDYEHRDYIQCSAFRDQFLDRLGAALNVGHGSREG